MGVVCHMLRGGREHWAPVTATDFAQRSLHRVAAASRYSSRGADFQSATAVRPNKLAPKDKHARTLARAASERFPCVGRVPMREMFLWSRMWAYENEDP